MPYCGLELVGSFNHKANKFSLTVKIGKFIKGHEGINFIRFDRKFKKNKQIIILDKKYTINSISLNGNDVEKIYPKLCCSIDIGEKINFEKGTKVYYQKYIV